MIIFRILTLLLIISGSIFGQIKERAIFDRARILALDYQLDQSDSLVLSLINTDNFNPAYYQLLAKNYLWRFLSTKDTVYSNKFFEYSNQAILNIDNFKSDISREQFFMAGWIYSLRAAAYTQLNESMDALWAADDAVENFEDCLSENPNFNDAYLGLGFFNYALSFTPKFVQWAISVLGLSADKEKGFEYIKLAYEKGSIAKIEAKYQLAKMYSEFTCEFARAEKLFSELHNDFPHNPLFSFDFILLEMKSKQLAKAVKLIDEYEKLNIKYSNQISAYVQFLKSEIFFRQNNFEAALKTYDEFFKLTRTIDYLGIANYHAAVSSIFLGKDNEARRFLILAGNGNTDLPEDNFAYNSSINTNEIDKIKSNLKTIKLQNYILAGNYILAEKFYSENILDFKKNDLLPELLFSESLQENENFSQSKEILLAIKSLEIAENWKEDYLNLLFAKYYFKKNELQRSAEFISDTGEFEGYEYQKNKNAEKEALIRKISSSIPVQK